MFRLPDGTDGRASTHPSCLGELRAHPRWLDVGRAAGSAVDPPDPVDREREDVARGRHRPGDHAGPRRGRRDVRVGVGAGQGAARAPARPLARPISFNERSSSGSRARRARGRRWRVGTRSPPETLSGAADVDRLRPERQHGIKRHYDGGIVRRLFEEHFHHVRCRRPACPPFRVRPDRHAAPVACRPGPSAASPAVSMPPRLQRAALDQPRARGPWRLGSLGAAASIPLEVDDVALAERQAELRAQAAALVAAEPLESDGWKFGS